MRKWLAGWVLRRAGWEIAGSRPELPKFVFIAAPHTSNWDLFWMLLFSIHFGVKIAWLGKHVLFRPPFGWFMRLLGGIAVDRRKPQGLVAQAVDAFSSRERFVLVVPPSGTRKRGKYWKSGFYHIAKGAGVPIVLGFLDYGKREGGIGPQITPSHDLEADMDQIRAFYEGKTGRYPENTMPIRLEAEESSRRQG